MAILWALPAIPEPKVTIGADQHRLQQVFFNITINALKAMSAGGTVSVRVSTERLAGRPWVRVAFEDQGGGIPPENLAKIFEAGFTTHRSSPGLGLAVCKRVMSQHGGTLEASSVEGQGSTFTLSFPVLEA
jgi:signal transduction histidine kinase